VSLVTPYFRREDEYMLIVSFSEIFTNSFIEHLFELVEQTRHMQDETLNYSVIKLIVGILTS